MKIAVLWYGLPYYGARVIGEARQLYPEVHFSFFATAVGIPYSGLEAATGAKIKWIDDKELLTWSELGADIPDICIITSWSHPSYIALAQEAKLKNNAVVISMTDNYFHGSLKQWAGAVFFRLSLRCQFDYMWVPGRRASRFMRFLGMSRERIMTGLYAADTDLFYPPEAFQVRSGVVFVGQFIVRKGVENIIKAVGSACGYNFINDLRFIGHGPLESRMRDSNLRTEGFMQAVELGGVYRQASALILPSFMDHWGVVAHEATLCGCLILATQQCGCVDDLVEDGVNGFIMKESSPAEILRALEWHAGLSPAQLEEGRRVSLEKAAHFSPRNWAEKLNIIINAVSHTA